MRPAAIALALGLPALTAALAVSGAALRADLAEPAADQAPAAMTAQEAAAETPHPVLEDRTSRLVAAAEIAPPELGDDPIERVAPRQPLGELGLAALPRRRQASPLLHRPVAVESAVVEAGDRRVAIAGTQSVGPGETCEAGGVSWPCGASARTAFRLWLRGRTLECDLPDDAEEPEAGDIVAPCRLAGQDAGRWLVANGWARAAPGGPYEEAGKAARDAGKGIFGRPPAAAVVSTPPLDLQEPAQ
jgi:endonuclease YncB( thermonuclease family)